MSFPFIEKKIKLKKDGIAVIGLTGQSGSGKTLVSDYLGGCGYSVINADLVARAVTVRGSDCNKKLSVLFPDCVNDRLELNRRMLGAIVFADREKLDLLNKTIFPYINELIETEIDEYKAQGSKLVILDAPTLFEAGADKYCDLIISVISDDTIREKRIAIRDNLDDKQIADRFSSQKPKSFYVKNSDYILENNNSKEELLINAKALLQRIKEKLDVR